MINVSADATKAAEQQALWTTSWWMPRLRAKLEEATARADVELVWLGDSITHYWEDGPGSTGFNQLAGAGRHIWSERYAQNSINLGHNGDGTQHVLWRLQHGAVAGLCPKAVIVLVALVCLV